MGCKNSKTRECVSNNDVADDSINFLNLIYVRKHPVAIQLLREWTVFVDAQASRIAGNPSASYELAERPREIWATDENNAVTHCSVDNVGKMFLEYIKVDLLKRGWGGNFDYKVAGVAKQGFIRAGATVETALHDVTEMAEWEIKIHYHSDDNT